MAASSLLTVGSLVGAASPAAPRHIPRPQPAPVEASAMPPLPPAQFDPTLSIGGDDVKARKVDSRLGVDVSVNGHGPYRFIVDSGADTSVVGLGIARQLQLPSGTSAILNGVTGRDVVERVKVDSLSLGSTTVHELQLPVLSEPDMGAEGMVGIDALSQQRLMMDFDRHLIRIEDARTPVHALPGEIVVTARRLRGQLILAQVRASRQRLDAIVDTGAEVTLGNLALRDRLVRRKRAAIQTVQLTGVTGEKVDAELAIVDELQLGTVVLRNVPIAFADLPLFGRFGLADQPALMLGTDILGNFRRVSLDFKARKVRFELRRCGSQRIVSSMFGDHLSSLAPAAGQEACR